MEILALIIVAVAGICTAIAKVYRFGPFLDRVEPVPSLDRQPEPPAPYTPSSVPVPSRDHLPPPPEVPLLTPDTWDTQEHAYHSVRVICDNMGLTLEQKNLICSCIYQESEFKNWAIGRNNGSTDWGIVQINDYWHIGKGKTFPSVEYVVNNPKKCVEFMIKMYKAGKLDMWISYKSGDYKKWLSPESPMWLLKVV